MVGLVPKCIIGGGNFGHFSGIYNILWILLPGTQMKQAARKAACDHLLNFSATSTARSDPGALRGHL